MFRGTFPYLVGVFVKRWREETSSFHMSVEKIIMMGHISMSKDEGAMLKVRLLGAELVDADREVTKTKGAHAMTTYLKALFKDHLQHIAGFTEEDKRVEVERH
jgi:hypothetical protein